MRVKKFAKESSIATQGFPVFLFPQQHQYLVRNDGDRVTMVTKKAKGNRGTHKQEEGAMKDGNATSKCFFQGPRSKSVGYLFTHSHHNSRDASRDAQGYLQERLEAQSTIQTP
jgi:hypothetical protein